MTRFNDLRLLRNKIVHSVDTSMELNSSHVLEQILEISADLFGERQWADLRRAFLERLPDSSFARNQLVYELNCLFDHMRPSACLRHFGFRKNRRRLYCHICEGEMDTDWYVEEDKGLAQLVRGQENMIYCTACNREHEVHRIACPNPACKGNVCGQIYGDELICLTCKSPLTR